MKNIIDTFTRDCNKSPSYLIGDELIRLCTYFYNQGYKDGHYDTVESDYTDIDAEDMETYHTDEVNEILNGK